MMSTSVLAQTAASGGAQAAPSLLEMLVLPLGFLVIMYFLVIRPQQKKVKEHSTMISTLKAGDEVMTTGGIIGRIRSVAEAFVTLEIASNTVVKVAKANISGLSKVVLGTGGETKA